jgi:hypothetical protein
VQVPQCARHFSFAILSFVQSFSAHQEALFVFSHGGGAIGGAGGGAIGGAGGAIGGAGGTHDSS